MDDDMDDSQHEEAKRELEGYLNERMRVRISDGRVVDGMFQCTDKHRNIVLANCEEFLSQEELEASEKAPGVSQQRSKLQPRTLSLAIIPGEHICSMQLATDSNEHLSRETSPLLTSPTLYSSPPLTTDTTTHPTSPPLITDTIPHTTSPLLTTDNSLTLTTNTSLTLTTDTSLTLTTDTSLTLTTDTCPHPTTHEI